MAEAVSAVAMADSAREVKQVRTVVWVMSLALVGLLFDGYDLVGSMTPTIPSTLLDNIYLKSLREANARSQLFSRSLRRQDQLVQIGSATMAVTVIHREAWSA